MSASDQAVLNVQWNAAQEACLTEQARRAPHVLMRPALTCEGTKWCALYGDDLMDGVAGFGDTPEEAMEAFDKEWRTQRTPEALLKAAGLDEPPMAVCSMCGKQTCLACADCGIDSAGTKTVHVCMDPKCRDAHEALCHTGRTGD